MVSTDNHLTLEEFARTCEEKGLSDTLIVEGTLTFKPDDEFQASPLSHALRRMQTDLRSTSPELLITETLGEGGMGLVRLARQIALDREVAVKTLRTDTVPNAAIIRLLLNEACIAGLLEHPNIVPIYTIGQGEHGEPLIVMKRIEGRPWSDFIRDPKLIDLSEFGDALTWHLQVLIQVCNAVHFAHSRGILHRDLKPENIMIGEFGEVCVLDWGIALALDDRYSERFPLARDVRVPAGTPQYMSPEMAAGDGDRLGVQTDVYLLGAILYEVLEGQAPHRGNNIMEILFSAYRAMAPALSPTVPDGLARICQQAMQPSPKDRFSDVEAFRRALSDFLRHRESMEITRGASERLNEVIGQLTRQDDDPKSSIDHGFVESRFGFVQALRLWPENLEARTELNRLLVAMFDFELDRENASAASSLLAEMDTPDPSLLNRLEALEQTLIAREAELESLKEVQHAHDVKVGSLTRGRAFQFFGIALLTTPFSKQLAGLQDYVIDMRAFLLLLIPYFILIVCVTFAGRRVLFSNRFNRAAFSTLFLIFGAICLQRFQVWWTNGDIYSSLVNEFLFHAFGFALVGLTSERQVFLGSVPFWIGYVIGVFYPMMVVEILSISGGIATFGLGTMWVRQEGS